MFFGDACVSTEAQDLTSRVAQWNAGGCEKIFRESSGTGP